ncbi:MAG: hypothetical protein HOH19_04850 [Kordiimonadaceae bacterium]|nr:hypothetical protein [Kordiimonadaceae bacterium]
MVGILYFFLVLRLNLTFATAASRLHYYRVPEEIPDTLERQAEYWKKY